MSRPERPRIVRRRVDGVLLLDKPVGLSSNAALQRAKWLLRAEKAGHTGTLDPLASGLLPLCFGEATKLAQFLLDATKRYTATLTFGATTTTGDAEGTIVATAPVDFSDEDLATTLQGFVGRLAQVPPAHAALKHEGRPYYAYARAGVAVPRVARDIEVHALRLLGREGAQAMLDVECSKGTYVRVLAEDIGARLGCGAHLSGLRRTATGGFHLADAVTLDQLEALDELGRDGLLLPPAVLARDLPQVRLDAGQAVRFRQGGAVPVPGEFEGVCAVFDAQELLGVADVAQGRAQPRRLLVAPLLDNLQRA
jgi:tRNA pseudouridine55 synthase